MTAPTPAASRTYTTPDVLANADFVMTQGNQTIAGTKIFSGAIQLATTGGTAASLNFYSETTQTPFSLTGNPFNVSPQNTTVRYVRVGKIVTVLFTGITAASGAGSAGNITSTTLIPLEYRPAITFKNITTVVNTGAQTVGTVQIDTAGVMTFTRASAIGNTENTFQAGGPTVGVDSFQCAWVVA